MELKLNINSQPLGSAQRSAKTLCWLLPALVWVAYSFFSYPLMYPGLDAWIHLASMEFAGRRQDPWHLFWGWVFAQFNVAGPFAQAKLVHTTQALVLGSLLFVAARWFLKLAFVGRQMSPALMNLGAWLAVLVWLLMHGTVSSPIGSGFSIWYGWLQWYSVNYQLALPLYVFAVSGLLYGLFGHHVKPMGLVERWANFFAAGLATVGVAVLHAAELPYVMFALLIIGLVWFNRAWWRYYVFGLMAVLGLLLLGLEASHRLPTGIVVLSQEGPAALFAKIETHGTHLVNGLNRGNASWNYWYWTALASAFVALILFWHASVYKAERNHSIRVVAVVLLSALLAAMLHFKWTAGALAMVTYPNLAWRFSFSSLLFVGPSLALLAIASQWPKLGRLWVQVMLAGGLVLGVLLASRQTEANLVSYQYARGLAMSLSAQQLRFGLEPHEAKWLDAVHTKLLLNPPDQLVCTDMFTAYYLFFVKGYAEVVLPRRISRFIDSKRREGECQFPRDGGKILQQMNVGSVPWRF